MHKLQELNQDTLYYVLVSEISDSIDDIITYCNITIIDEQHLGNLKKYKESCNGFLLYTNDSIILRRTVIGTEYTTIFLIKNDLVVMETIQSRGDFQYRMYQQEFFHESYN